MSERICLGCTAVITSGPRERNPKRWCSPACRARTEYAAGKRSHHYPRCHIWTPTCVECGAVFTARSQRADTCQRAACRDARRARSAAAGEHGTSAGYYGRDCRCDECREFARLRMREYRKDHPAASNAGRFLRTCECCGAEWKTGRRTARFCSYLCRDYTRHGPLSWPLPVERTPSEPRIHQPVPKMTKTCEWCEASYTTHQSRAKFCSDGCSKRHGRMIRKGRIHNAYGTYTWAEVTRLFLAFDRCCAYCEQPVTGQLDPDHVVPISRGGVNSITNILPACHRCNGDKRDLLLSEWAGDRSRRGLEPVRTTWADDDRRFIHLTIRTERAA